MASTPKKGATTRRSRRNGHKTSAKAKPANGAGGDLIFDALGESVETLFTLSKASHERTYRLAAAAINDAQLTQRDLLSLARRWAEAPLDLLGWSSCVVETAVKTQARLADGARRWREELAQAGLEARDALQRTTRANWRAGRAAFGLARGAITKS